MNKLFLILLLLPLSYVFSQELDFREQRKGKLFFSVGTEYRITPLPVELGTIPEFSRTNPDRQNSGSAFYYGLKFFATKNFSLGFSHSIRYTLLNHATNNDIANEIGVKEDVYKLFMGYHFYLDYHVKVFKKSELFARIGVSMLNTNSGFTYKESFFDSNGIYLGSSFSHLNYIMYPKNFAIGFKKNKFEAIIGMYATNDPPYFTESVMYITPYINLNYTIGKLF